MADKKGLLVLVLAALVTGVSFALPNFKLSAGIGGFGGISTSQDIYFKGGGGYGLGSINVGGYAFFDATYLELSLGVSGGPNYLSLWDSSNSGDIPRYDLSKTNFSIGLLVKYPFKTTEKLSLFPLLGINYMLAFLVEGEGEKYDEPNDFSEFWLEIGAGMDYSFTQNIYLRFTPLLGFRLPTKYEKDLMERRDGYTERAAISVTARLAVGFRF